MVPEIKNLLFTTDMSETSNFAFNYAASIANRYDATITILHVLKNSMPTQENLVTNVIGEKKWLDIVEQNKVEVVEDIRSRLEKFCEEVKAELPSCPFFMEEAIVRIGNPVEEIIREVNQNKYDLVIMGAHGHGAISGTVMGSVSRRVLRRSKIPVLVVRLPDHE